MLGKNRNKKSRIQKNEICNFVTNQKKVTHKKIRCQLTSKKQKRSESSKNWEIIRNLVGEADEINVKSNDTENSSKRIKEKSREDVKRNYTPLSQRLRDQQQLSLQRQLMQDNILEVDPRSKNNATESEGE